ncbi:MAG: hypothetical protein ACE5FU_08060, partial [Nitrospinota bacterium]
YGLCLKSLINVLPHKDKEYHYAHRYNSAELAVELLQTTPVHFSLIDGVSSNHGQQGSRYSRPIDTKVLIGSPDLLLTDWTGALKMGVDPYISPINALGLKNKGLPETYELRGDLSPYSGWENVHPMVIHSVQKRNSHFAIRKLLRPWFTTVNRELFPFKNPLDDRINSMLTELLNKEVGSKRSESMLMLVNYLIGFFSGIYSSYTISLDKDRVYRKDTDIGFDYTAFSEEDHKNVIQYMKPFAAIAKSCVPDKNGLRWRYIDKSVVFIYDRILPVPYEDFVKKVDISSAVRMMNDNVGGTCLPVLWDEQKRVRHQVERDIYLPQPNWMSMYGGDFIDVGKIECITYEKDSQNIYWKSVASVNNSTLHDDGIVTFERVSQSTTKITIVARQQFALPPLWQIIDMDLIPEFKNQLVSDSYITFFSRTMANYEAMYEGRNVETGCKYDPNFGEDCYEKGSTDILHTFANRFAGFLEPFLAWASQSIMTPDLEKILSSVFGSKWEEKKASFPSNTSSTPLKDFLDTVVHDLVSVAQKDIEFWSKVSRKESA